MSILKIKHSVVEGLVYTANFTDWMERREPVLWHE